MFSMLGKCCKRAVYGLLPSTFGTSTRHLNRPFWNVMCQYICASAFNTESSWSCFFQRVRDMSTQMSQQIIIVGHFIYQPPEITMYQQFSISFLSSLYKWPFPPRSTFFLPNNFSTLAPGTDLPPSGFQPLSRPSIICDRSLYLTFSPSSSHRPLSHLRGHLNIFHVLFPSSQQCWLSSSHRKPSRFGQRRRDSWATPYLSMMPQPGHCKHMRNWGSS